jgi:hypothetical protein
MAHLVVIGLRSGRAVKTAWDNEAKAVDAMDRIMNMSGKVAVVRIGPDALGRIYRLRGDGIESAVCLMIADPAAEETEGAEVVPMPPPNAETVPPEPTEPAEPPVKPGNGEDHNGAPSGP